MFATICNKIVILILEYTFCKMQKKAAGWQLAHKKSRFMQNRIRWMGIHTKIHL